MLDFKLLYIAYMMNSFFCECKNIKIPENGIEVTIYMPY